MKNTVTTISGKTLTIECNAATPIVFKRVFRQNIFNGFQQLNDKDTDEKVEFMNRVIFIFSATSERPMKELLNLSEDDYLEFLTQFDMLELADENLMNAVISLWGADSEGLSTPKNQQGPQQER